MAVSVIAGIVGTLVGPVTELLSEVVTDKDKRDALAYKLSTLAATQTHEQTLAQIDVNKIDAASKHLFVAGWRPFIGWTCGFAMAFNYIGVPLLGAAGVTLAVLDITTMFPVLLGMLGLAGLRTGEKVKGVSREK